MQVYSNELYHFGVLGMKWGHHKRQPESAAVIRAKAKKAETKVELKKAQRAMDKESVFSKTADATMKKLIDTNREHRYATEDLNHIKTLEKIRSKPKTEKQLSLEQKYKEKGMSDDEAAVAAFNNIRTKKILTAVGATVITGAVAYAAYKIHSEYADKVIKTGTQFQNIATDKDEGLRDAFYTTQNRFDKIKYKGMYGSHLSADGSKVVKKQIDVMGDIKQISPKNAKNSLHELIKDDKQFGEDFKKYMEDHYKLGTGGAYGKKHKSALDGLSKGVLNKDAYEVFNASLVDHSPEMQKLTDKYFSTLSAKGYNAIKDVNDSKYSGYNTHNPIIAFNLKDKVKLSSVTELSDGEREKAWGMAMGMLTTSALIKQLAVVGGVTTGLVKTAEAHQKRQNNKLIANYRKQNPKTKMSNMEIIRMLERQQ